MQETGYQYKQFKSKCSRQQQIKTIRAIKTFRNKRVMK